MLRSLVNSVAQAVPGVTSEAIVYPAQLDFNNLLSYVSSERSGVSAGKSQITAYVKRCPKSKIVVTGVSQVRPSVDLALADWSREPTWPARPFAAAVDCSI
jgi:hypothetical protein